MDFCISPFRSISFYSIYLETLLLSCNILVFLGSILVSFDLGLVVL